MRGWDGGSRGHPRPETTPGGKARRIYLPHFSHPVGHARHYWGYTHRTAQERMADHLQGNGSPLVRAAVLAGTEVRIVRTWRGGRKLERKLKRQKHAWRFCPICRSERGMGPIRGRR